MQRIGLISDTHGLLRPGALAALQGCDRIVHAGDIGRAEILQALAALAPLDVVRGNNDVQPWAKDLPHALTLQVEGVSIHLLHDAKELRGSAPPGARVVVSGHSHKPSLAERGGVLWVNPGSAGPRRFKLPVGVGMLEVDGNQVRAQLVTLAA